MEVDFEITISFFTIGHTQTLINRVNISTIVKLKLLEVL